MGAHRAHRRPPRPLPRRAFRRPAATRRPRPRPRHASRCPPARRALLSSYTGAVVLVTHDRNEAFRMCDQLAILSNGRIDAAGPRHDLFARPRTLAAARVTGCKNFARMRPCDPHHIRVDEWGAIL